MHQICSEESGAAIYSNAARNLMTGQDHIRGVTYHIYQGNYLYVNGILSGELVQKEAGNRIYQVTIDLYEGDYTGVPVYTLHANKLQ